MSVRPWLVFIVLSCVTPPALAQQPPSAPQTVPPFVLQSDDGDNRVQVAGLAQLDGRFADERVLDTFLIRRARISLQGRLARVFEFFVQPEFAAGAPSLFDAYLDIRFSNAFRVRAGKAKVPFGLERLHSAANLLFVERAFPTALVPNRDVGLQLLGDVAAGAVTYGVSLTNGVADGASADLDTNEGKDVAARVLVRPLARNTGHVLTGLSAGVAASAGDQPATPPVFRTSAQQTFFSYVNGTTASGRRTRVSPQVSYYAGAFGGFAEYVRSRGQLTLGTTSAEVDHSAWQVAASWVLTGESASDRGVRPQRNFDPERGGVGAIQMTARYSAIELASDAAAASFVAPGASRRAEMFTVGLNWYVNPYVRWIANVERTVFAGTESAVRPAEKALLFRGQLAF